MVSPESILGCFGVEHKRLLTGPVQCPSCGDCYRSTKHGYYPRYFPGKDEVISIPRYRCNDQECERATFSILPFPCLRFKRHSLAEFMTMVGLAKFLHIWELARCYEKGWGAMRRLLGASRQIVNFFLTEREHQSWGLWPCLKPELHWTDFTQALSKATVPGPT